MRFVLAFWAWIIIMIILIMVFARPAKANDDLILQGQMQLNLNRPISVVVTDDVRSACGDYESPDLYACAKNHDGKGRCIVFIRPDRLAWLYHEQQHCAGLEHEPEQPATASQPVG